MGVEPMSENLTLLTPYYIHLSDLLPYSSQHRLGMPYYPTECCISSFYENLEFNMTWNFLNLK